jgi:quercetin dioxygenase-like cupin family protein
MVFSLRKPLSHFRHSGQLSGFRALLLQFLHSSTQQVMSLTFLITGIGCWLASGAVPHAIRIMPQEQKKIRAGEIGIRFLLEGKDSNGQVAMFEFEVPAGSKVPIAHSHKRYDETIYGLEGVLTFTIAGNPVEIAAGETCFIPRGVVHGFNNLKHTNAKALAIVTPALLGPDYFREIADLINDGGPPDLEKIKAVMDRHGLVPAPPPN